MSPRMRQRPRHGYTFDFSTPCPECGYVIQPEELELTGFSKIRCPQCRKEFATRRTGPSIGLQPGLADREEP